MRSASSTVVATPRMRLARRAILGALLAACCWALPACDAIRYHSQIRDAMFTPQQGARDRLEVHGRVPILHLYGTPREMGEQYGRRMGPALRALSGYATCMLSEAQRRRFLEYGRGHERYLPPEIRVQLRATAETGGIDYDELVALNVTPRLLCSTLAVWGPSTPDGHMLMGRNGDYRGMGLDDCGNLLVVYHPAEGQGVVLVSFLGMAGGFAGMNARGVAFGNMLVFNSKGWRDDALPIQLAMGLAARSAGSAREMADRLAGMKHVIPNNAMAVDAREALVAELGCQRAHIRRGSGGVLAASNNFLEHPDRRDSARCARYDSLMSDAAKHPGAMTVEAMKSALLDARILWINIQATIFQPAQMRMHVSINRNPASAGPYVTLDVARLLTE